MASAKRIHRSSPMISRVYVENSSGSVVFGVVVIVWRYVFCYDSYLFISVSCCRWSHGVDIADAIGKAFPLGSAPVIRLASVVEASQNDSRDF